MLPIAWVCCSTLAAAKVGTQRLGNFQLGSACKGFHNFFQKLFAVHWLTFPKTFLRPMGEISGGCPPLPQLPAPTSISSVKNRNIPRSDRRRKVS